MRALRRGRQMWLHGAVLGALLLVNRAALDQGGAGLPASDKPAFQTSDRCLACHNGLTTAGGEDISIGIHWRSSIMANSSRDPYWQASVRRETLDHASVSQDIEDECSVCHMPIARYHARVEGKRGEVFSHLPIRLDETAQREAADGVSCSVCHQITEQNLGRRESFNGAFVVAPANASGGRAEYGPFDIDAGLMHVMRTSTEGFEPTRGDHIRTSEVCATCHTLITKALGADGEEIGSLPEQMPYQEWLHSDFRKERTCQSCHMPVVEEDVAIARVLGVKRSGMARHEFIAGNFFMQGMLGRYRDELHGAALPSEFSAAAERTRQYLQSQAARVTLTSPQLRGGRLETQVAVENIGGHKLPTAYPSRRAWLHVVVRERDGGIVFESGALNPDGSIRGNDNDADPRRFERHYTEIRSADEVQIYESILGDRNGAVTTGLLSATGYLKDNRVLPRGFDKNTAPAEIAVQGDAARDPAFDDRGHRLRYSVAVDAARGPFDVSAELWYQPIGFRWASNLQPYDAEEPQRFVRYYASMSTASAVLIARAASGSER